MSPSYKRERLDFATSVTLSEIAVLVDILLHIGLDVLG